MPGQLTRRHRLQRIQHERFTTEQHGYRLVDLSMDLSGNIAVSGRHSNGRIFIDLYLRNSDSRDKLKLFYSKEFETYSNYSDRYVSFLEKNRPRSEVVTCSHHKIEILDTNGEGRVLRSRRVNGRIECLAVREGEIFIGLLTSQTVIVFNYDLRETRTIRLRGIKDDDWPWDLQVINDTVFVRTQHHKAYAISVSDGSTITQYADITGKYSCAWSITASERLGLVAVVWGMDRIIVYSLNETKSLLLFDVAPYVCRIRISDNDRTIMTGNEETGEIKMHDLEQLFSFDAMKMTLANIVSPDECEKLRKYFGVTEEDMGKNQAGDEEDSGEISEEKKTVKRMECLLAIIGGKGYLDFCNVKNLKDAVVAISDGMRAMTLRGPIEGYTLYGLLSFRVKYRDLTAQVMARQKAWEDEQNQLSSALRTEKIKVNEYKKTVGATEGELQKMKNQLEEQEHTLTHQLEKTNKSLDSSKEKINILTKELDHIRTESAKTVERLTEELTQTKQSFDSSKEQIKILTGELDQTKAESSKIAERLTEELTQTKQSLDSSREKIQTLTGELDQTKQESTKAVERLTKKLAGSIKETETLTKKLRQTNQSLEESKEESTKQTEIFKDQLEQTRRNSAKEIEMLSDELKQSRAESTTKVQSLTEELNETKQSLNTNKTESAKMINDLNKELDQSSSTSLETICTLKEELTQTKQSMDLIRSESVRKIEKLTLELHSNIEEKETLYKDLQFTERVLERTKADRDVTRTELERYKLDFAKESKALKEVLDQTKQAMAELQKGPVVEKPPDDSEETRDGDTTNRAADFGRLTVAIAEQLTLDHCLKLARLFDIPTSECDIVRRLSLVETPGVKFPDVLKKRQVINMFDVSNLQKGLAMLHLEKVNHELVGPYQESIDDEQYEIHKVEEIYSWEDIKASVKDDAERLQIRESQTSHQNDSEPGEASQLGATRSWSEARVEDSQSHLADRPHHKLYTESSIGKEGGTIEVAQVSLSIPPGALHESHVIALSVMSECPFPLDREVDTARMTPLIKLEPLGLTFKKTLQLNIPHSALIPEPESHDVIIYSGQTNIDSSDSVTWTEERSIPRQLKEKSVTVDIQCLSYFSTSLVSQTTAPHLHIVRAVPFVDGVRNTDDDITLIVCFCSDNDSEYHMLLADYKTKLPLEQYSTLQLHRHSESNKDDAGFLSLTVTSVNNTYVPDSEQGVKRFAVSHLCTASRVTHQLRLKKNQNTDRDVLDIKLKFSQAQYETIEISLKARIKDLIISEEGEKFLTGTITPGSKTYEETVVNISSNLDREQCRELAAHFHLTAEDTDMVISNQEPGIMLVKILEEREFLDSQKVILFFEGLKACHLDEMADIVSEYLSKISKQKQDEQALKEDKKIEKPEENVLFSKHLPKKGKETFHFSVSDHEVQTTLSSSCVSSDEHVITLTNEGYAVQYVVEALDISKNRLVLARRVLNYLREQLDIVSAKAMLLYKEQYIDENGGDIILREANVHMVIPAGAISKGSIVSVTVMTSKLVTVPSEGRAPQLTPVIKCGQESLSLNKPVTIRIPHCAAETEGITSTDMYMGFSTNEANTRWRKRNQHEPSPVLKEDHFEVLLTQFCAISLNAAVDYKKPSAKRLRIIPLIRRVPNSTDDLTVTVWIYNDDETEHMHLLHDEINMGDNIQLDQYKRFILKGSDKEKDIDIKSGNNRINLHKNTNVHRVLSTTLWNKGRHSVAFHFQNKDGINDISFRLRMYTRQLLLMPNVDLQFDLKITLSELLQKPKESTRTALKTQEPQPAMEKSFQELISRLSGQLGVDACLEISEIFGLPGDCRDKVKKSTEPGNVLFDELIHEQFISAASVSALDVALTKTGNFHLAEDVREYRRRNVAFPTTIFSSL